MNIMRLVLYVILGKFEAKPKNEPDAIVKLPPVVKGNYLVLTLS